MRRRSPTVTALLAVVALVLLPAISNVEANALPGSWAPLLWIAWPAGLMLAAPLVYWEIRQRHHRPGLASEHGAASADERQRRDRAVLDLAAAVRRQWTDELARRSVRHGAPLRVRWENTARPVAGHLADVVREDLAHPLTAVSGDTAEDLITLLDSLQDGQVVIIGEPGSGKTVLTVQFALQVLAQRQADDPVPVLLTLSSWNPAAEDLPTWLARRILEDYPALGNEEVYGMNAASALVAHGRVLAVLDGLDEMPASARPTAMATLDRSAGAEHPMVVTCRSKEYEDAVATHGEFLSRAVVVELQPVDFAEARRYLIAAAPAGTRRWQSVLDELDAQPNAPLARVLTSPLMIALARTVYTAPASSPGELLTDARFAKSDQIESHLLDGFVDAAYRDTPVIPETTLTPRYPPQRAKEWLVFLARHLSDQQIGDLAWWHLWDMVPRAGRALVAGVAVGLVFGLSNGLVAGVAAGQASGLTAALAVGPGSGAVSAVGYCLVAALIAGFGRPRPPTRAQLRFQRTTRPFLGRFAASGGMGLTVALTAGMPVSSAIGLGLVVGLAFAAQVWLDTPTDATERPTPRVALRQNRTAALGFGLTLAVAFGFFESMNSRLGAAQSFAAAGPLRLLVIAVVAVVAGGCAGYVLYGWIGCAVLGLIEASVSGFVLVESASGGLVGLVFVPFSGLQLLHSGTFDALFGITFGLAVGVTGVIARAWGSFCLVRIWLALRGQLPWRLMRFLDDAHRRGVLRQSGAVYQFRHARLQDRLASIDPRDHRRDAEAASPPAPQGEPHREQTPPAR
ncbi:MAG TPA: NACHT domain-containing protein [Pseudonocardiaceae bacterium]|jgi:hypothetical protein|nr:NACHT domain-containing protein [Pseudonocardiaceae bacterium]